MANQEFGVLFVLVVAFLPAGVTSLPGVLRRSVRKGAAAPGEPDPVPAPEGPPLVEVAIGHRDQDRAELGQRRQGHQEQKEREPEILRS